MRTRARSYIPAGMLLPGAAMQQVAEAGGADRILTSLKEPELKCVVSFRAANVTFLAAQLRLLPTDRPPASPSSTAHRGGLLGAVRPCL